jgi:hypothetical protein
MQILSTIPKANVYTVHTLGRSASIKVKAESHILLGETYCLSKLTQEELEKALLAGRATYFVFEIDKSRVKYLERGNVVVNRRQK